MSARNVLVARLDKVGDLVLSTPFLANLRRALPEARITALVNSYNRGVLEHNPDVDEIVENPRDLRPGGFDLGISLSPTMATYRTIWRSGARQRAGIVYASRWPALILSPLLLTDPLVLELDEALHEGRPVLHEVRQMLKLGEQLGFPMPEVPLKVVLDAEDRAWAQKLLGQPGLWIGLQLSPRWYTGNWGREDVVLLAHHVMQVHPDVRLLITYGPTEREEVEWLRRVINQGALEGSRVCLAGDVCFSRWAALIAACRIFVSPDTGSLHVAAACQVPTVAVYEDATYEHCVQQWAPWQARHYKVRKGRVPDTLAGVVAGLEALTGAAAAHHEATGPNH
ncbi:MAG: glycosyltransferase family 9 protein [Candidatus Xenobia bacterium]